MHIYIVSRSDVSSNSLLRHHHGTTPQSPLVTVQSHQTHPAQYDPSSPTPESHPLSQNTTQISHISVKRGLTHSSSAHRQSRAIASTLELASSLQCPGFESP